MTIERRELFELCKDVYERTRLGYPITDFERGIVIHWEDGQMFDFPTDELDIEEYIAPLYTSDYLLEKLPSQLHNNNGESNWLDMYAEDDLWYAMYEYASSEPDGESYTSKSDTPLKALLKLTLKLHEEGIL